MWNNENFDEPHYSSPVRASQKLKNKVFPATGSDSQKKQLSRITILKVVRNPITE
jgi:hypothetical protein